MIIDSLELTNFRNYPNFKIDFHPITVFIGANGIGKTNIVEAISIISYTKSFRARNERNLILNDQNYAQIQTKLSNSTQINFVISKEGKNIKKEVKVNQIKQNLTKLVGKLKVVLFSPETLKIVTGSPSDRRRFIDILASQMDEKYLENLAKLKHVIKQKNYLLKSIYLKNTNPSGLAFWNRELIKCSRYIIKKREEIIKYLEKKVQENYKNISSKDDKIRMIYDPKISDIDKIEDLVNSAQEREIEAQKTLYSPQLDDIKFLMNNKILSEIGSRGEIRTLIFCLKLAEINYLEEKDNKEDILLLLDDIFSELDIARREKIVELIRKRQTIITVTERELVNLNFENMHFINLENYGKNRQSN